MSVYKRGDSEFYSYDFRLDGKRYTGFTGARDVDAARIYEQSVKDSLLSISSFCRAIIRKATYKTPIQRRSEPGYVYMIRSRYFIKIGHSLDPEQRFEKMLTASPEDCELLFYIPGSMRLERELHAEFSACHYRREWFFHCGKLKQFIAEFEAQKHDALQPVPHDLPHQENSKG